MIAKPSPIIEDAIQAVRRLAADQNARSGDYYGAFPPTDEERDALIEMFASTLRVVIREAAPS